MKAIIRLSTSEITSRKAMLSFSFRPPFNLNERYLQSRVYAANGKDCIMSIVNILQSRVYAANEASKREINNLLLQSRVYAANKIKDSCNLFLCSSKPRLRGKQTFVNFNKTCNSSKPRLRGKLHDKWNS